MAYRIISVRVVRSLYYQLKALAKEEDSSMTDLIKEGLDLLFQDRKERSTKSSKEPLGFLSDEDATAITDFLEDPIYKPAIIYEPPREL